MGFLSSLLKRIDRLLQFDKFVELPPTVLYLHVLFGKLVMMCLKTFVQLYAWLQWGLDCQLHSYPCTNSKEGVIFHMPCKKDCIYIPHIFQQLCLSCHIHLSLLQDRISELIAPFRNMDKPWKVRIEASKVLIDLELHHKGLDAALLLFLKYVDEEKSLRGWLAGVLFSFFACFDFFWHALVAGATKLSVHVLRLCQASTVPHFNDQISLTTLIGLLHLLAGAKAYNNVFLRHHVFCILQVAAGRLANFLFTCIHHFYSISYLLLRHVTFTYKQCSPKCVCKWKRGYACSLGPSHQIKH